MFCDFYCGLRLGVIAICLTFGLQILGLCAVGVGFIVLFVCSFVFDCLFEWLHLAYTGCWFLGLCFALALLCGWD